LREYDESEESLRESEEKYRNLTENAPDIRYRTDTNGVLTFVSKSVLKLTGYSSDELIGKNASVLYLDSNKRSDFINLLEKDGFAENYISELKHKDGSFWWASTNATLIRDQDGTQLGIEGVSRDVTKQVQAEHTFKTLVESTAIHTGQELFDKIVSSLSRLLNCEYSLIGEIIDSDTVQVISIEVDGKIAENFSYKLKGTPSHQVMENGFCEYIDNLVDLFPEDQYLIDMNARGYVGIPLQRSDSDVLGILCAFSREKLNLPDHAADIMKVLQARAMAEIERKKMHDHNKQLEIQLHKTQRIEAIGTLAGGIAHDFNNILFPISGYVEILKDDLPDNTPSQDFLNRISNGVTRAGELVKQILMFGRQVKGENTVITIQTIIKEVVKLSRATIPSTIKIESHIDSDCGFVLADPTQIHQVVMNLITNAYQAIESETGILSISLHKMEVDPTNLPILELSPGPYVCLTVSDTGSGIHPDVIDKIL